MGFLKDMFSGNPWKTVDPTGEFRNKLTDILGPWDFSKLCELMEMYKVFEQNFFRAETFTDESLDQKLETFVVFINNWATSLVKNGQVRDAELIFRASIKLKGEINAAYLGLTGILAQTGRFKEAAEEAKDALKTIDRLESRYQNLDIPIPPEFHLGNTTELRQGLHGIISAVEENVNIDLKSADEWIRKGVAMGKSGDYLKAIESLKEAIRIKPDYADAHCNLGVVYAAIEDDQKAIESYKEAIRIKPDHANAHCNLGVAYVKIEDGQKAIESFKEAIRIKPDYAYAHCNLGVVYLAVSDRGSALNEYKILKDLDKELANKLFNLIYGK